MKRMGIAGADPVACTSIALLVGVAFPRAAATTWGPCACDRRCIATARIWRAGRLLITLVRGNRMLCSIFEDGSQWETNGCNLRFAG